MEHKKFPLGPEVFEVIDKNKVMESDFVFYTMRNLRGNYGCAIMDTADPQVKVLCGGSRRHDSYAAYER